MNKDLVSIIVPVYNVPNELLIKCLDSLNKQTYDNIEVIVVDDGSTNKETYNICAKYDDNLKFKVFHKTNGGLCDARNYGFDKSSGKWITFVDGDDYLSPDCIELLINKLSNDNIDIVCFGTIKEYKNSKFYYDYNNLFEDMEIYDDREFLLKSLLDFNSNIGDVTAKLYKKEFLLKYKILHNTEIKQGVEAIDFNYRCFENCNSMLFVKIYGYYYTYNPNSITLSISKNNIDLLHKGIKQLYHDIKNSKYDLSINLDTRVNYVVITTVISGIFSPNNKYTRKERKKLMKYLLDNKYIFNAINNHKVKLDFKRRIVIILIKHKLFLMLSLVSKIRNIQKGGL